MWRMWVLTVLVDRYSSAPISGAEVAGQAAEHAQLALAEVLGQLRASAGWRGQA